ncbi:hypothetical protein PROFUN_11405 [Planoprotostelium fungivorum]|uniref:Cell cycle control protein n=1 Tax=Planoprotostelium fungivorum TaxID=1890364 RepID=A0A2P6NA80_9EUKA|nr:hypothetical protein PROFUN_11405 [Planoprotostelium fungivorum]
MQASNGDAKSKRPGLTAFKQQQLRAWQPILTPFPVILTFLIIGVVFIPIGVVLLHASQGVVEVTQRYDDLCANTNSSCLVNVIVNSKMSQPVYMYYRLDNFYQNHRRYVKSRADTALQGDLITNADSLSACDPFVNNGTSGLASSYFPCGLIAASFFNDTFSMRDTNGTLVPWTKQGIAWRSDVEKKFGNIPADQVGLRLFPNMNQTDEDFIVWMRTAGLPNFKKLHRIINTDINPGTYQFNVTDNFPVSRFNGKKYIVLSTTSWMGGKNPFLGWAFIAVGAVCIVQGVAFAIKHKLSPRKLGDTKYLDWNK